MEELLTAKQVQEHLQVDRTTIYRMLKDGRLQGVKVGQQWRFPRPEVEALLSGAPAPDHNAPQLSRDILPVHCFQAIQDVSAEAVDVGAIITDTEGVPITTISHSCAFCNLILNTESGQQACIESWRKLAHQHEKLPQFSTCHAGFQYARARIEVDGVAPAMFVAGQFFTAPPDTAVRQAQIERLAEKHGLDAAELAAADRDTHVLNEATQAKISRWLQKLADTFAIISLERADMLNRLQRIADLSGLTRG
ncbi:MAG: PocR ligand-binding domain-containing protein [Chloroflexi bacterium]|nr:PocR ligand-binding domain-containing protein [Chloroflexota bacterium]